jgi:hypothetical protein
VARKYLSTERAQDKASRPSAIDFLWMNNGPVQLLSTIHATEDEQWFVRRNRCRPRETSTSAATVSRVFGNNPRMELHTPKAVDDYNHNMNGVEISDQYRSY